jgi:hypothetical protein
VAAAVDIERSVKEGSTVGHCVPMDGARAPRFLGRNLVTKFVRFQENAGQTPLLASTYHGGVTGSREHQRNSPLPVTPADNEGSQHAPESKMNKAEWLAEGAALGERGSKAAFEIGRWLVRGEQLFLIKKPTNKNKKAWRIYWSNCRQDFDALIAEAAAATNLAEKSLRQYALVIRRGAIVDGLTFAHHIEVMRAHHFDEKGNRRFDSMTALSILTLAKEKKWTVAQTRNEVSHRYPTTVTLPVTVQDALFKVKRIIDKVPVEQQLALIEALTTELADIKMFIKTPQQSEVGTAIDLGDGTLLDGDWPW